MVWMTLLVGTLAAGAAGAGAPATPAAGSPPPANAPDTSAAATAAAAPGPVAAASAPTADALPFRLRLTGTVAGGAGARIRIAEPSGIAVDAFGNLYVSDASLHRLQRFDARGAWLGESGSLGSDPGQLRRPGGVALLGTLSVAVLDLENRRVETYDLFGQRLGTLIDLLGTDFPSDVGRVDPVAMAADKGGALYLADGDGERVLAFEFSGRFVRAIGGIGSRPGSFRGLRGIAVAPRGDLVTAERVNARIQQLDAGGRVVASWPLDVRPGRGALAVAVDDSARVAVADESTGRLWVFDPGGRTLARLSGLEGPRALAFAGGGTLLVAEARAGLVVRLTLERVAPPTGAAEERDAR